jgi:hypothetical protein
MERRDSIKVSKEQIIPEKDWNEASNKDQKLDSQISYIPHYM